MENRPGEGGQGGQEGAEEEDEDGSQALQDPRSFRDVEATEEDYAKEPTNLISR